MHGVLFIIKFTNAQKIIDDNVSSIEKISIDKVPFDKGIFFKGNKSDFKWDLSEIELVKYKYSPFVLYRVASLNEKEVYSNILFFEGNTLGLISKNIHQENGEIHFELLSESEEPYFEFDVTEKSLLKNLS